MIEVSNTYDDLTAVYHLIFQDWNASIQRQASIISKLIPSAKEAGKVLDCGCGIGTQALGLATLGYQVEGTDISSGEIDRAVKEAKVLNLNISFRVDDMRQLETAPANAYGVVMAMDNCLPHLESDEEILRALKAMHNRLQQNGVLLLSLRDYEKLMTERPSIMPPAFYQDGKFRRFVHQIWDWLDERRYRFHLYLTLETENGWKCHHSVGHYRAITATELAALVRQAGFNVVEILLPEQSGYYQPVIRAAKA